MNESRMNHRIIGLSLLFAENQPRRTEIYQGREEGGEGEGGTVMAYDIRTSLRKSRDSRCHKEVCHGNVDCTLLYIMSAYIIYILYLYRYSTVSQNKLIFVAL